MSPSTGTLSMVFFTSSCIKPPSTTISPSSTTTVDSIERLLVMMPAGLVVSCTLETSWNTRNFTVRPSVTCGRTRNVRPTSRRSIVWNGLTAPPVAVDVAWAKLPVMNGTF